jgi:RNA polymerase sigma-70 factor (ECF subfamily)
MTSVPVSAMEVPTLLARVRGGDTHAFTALVNDHQTRVFRWAFALTGDRDDAEDVTQEVFVRVYRKLGSYRGDGAFDAWLYRITRRVALRSRRRNRAPESTGDADVYNTDPGARVDRERASALIHTIAATLPMRQREVFILCDLEGLAPSQAAETLGMKDVSVRASLFKARATIRRRILATHPHYQDTRS